MAEFQERLGQRISERREQLNLSQSDLARRLPGKIDGQQVSRWERGLHQPRPDTLEALAVALDTTVAYFIAAPADKTRTPDPFSTDRSGEIIDRLGRVENAISVLAEELQELRFELAEGAQASEAQVAPKNARAGRRGRNAASRGA